MATVACTLYLDALPLLRKKEPACGAWLSYLLQRRFPKLVDRKDHCKFVTGKWEQLCMFLCGATLQWLDRLRHREGLLAFHFLCLVERHELNPGKETHLLYMCVKCVIL